MANFLPTVVIIDSQSIKNSSTCTEQVDIDGGKLIKGRKRFYITDIPDLTTSGLSLSIAHKTSFWGF